jgi:hypothetical protein
MTTRVYCRGLSRGMNHWKKKKVGRHGPILRNLALLAVWIFLGLAAPGQSSDKGVALKRTSDVIYGRKAGMALTLDVFEPVKKNGAAVIYIVSGAWLSSHDDPTMVHVTAKVFEPFLNRGYTVFAVVHGSQPYFTIPDAILDIHRAVRFVRYHAEEYGVDRDRFGILGSSSGGELALMIATQGGPGSAESSDPVERESSAVQAAGCFFPPTDFLNFGKRRRGWRGTRPPGAAGERVRIDGQYRSRPRRTGASNIPYLLRHFEASPGGDCSRRRGCRCPPSAIRKLCRQGERSRGLRSQDHRPQGEGAWLA